MISPSRLIRAAALAGLVGVLALPLAAASDQASAFSDLTVKNLKFRHIGPANTGGRVTDIAVDPRNEAVIYVGEATGGLYKTSNGGVTWENAFAKEPVASIGAVAVAASKPDDVWAGTGEANTRNSVSWGDGVYVSHDGGDSWEHVGLGASKSIGRILIDPKNSNVVWVAALGNPFASGGERGVYKTTDGGKTWTASLKTDENTGAVDLAMDPTDSNVVFAAMYARRRNGYSFVQGSPSDGIYRTTDGGKTWERLQRGLPPQMRRIGLAVAQSNHRVVYAVVDSSLYGYADSIPDKNPAGGIFRSADGGQTWERRSDYDPRPFYFSQIRVDPKNPDRIYELNRNLATSTDGGKNFKETSGEDIHPDWHALWIDPANPKHLVAGTDGGVYVSRSRGESWGRVHNMATGEFYTASYDYARPYDVCGGMQDNYTWCGPSTSFNEQGITNSDWVYVGFGCDGFYVQIDPRRPWIVWDECQGGSARRIDLRTGQRTEIAPQAIEGTPDFRFNWNTPLALDRFNPDVLYMGGNHLFKLTADGRHWQTISPDLSKHIPGTTATAGSSANYGTIVTISQSPLDRRIIWVGTDDGNVQLTRDGGATWTDVTSHLPAEVRKEWVSRIDASRFSAGRAYVAINGHYDSDFRPHTFVTDDLGATWRTLSAGLPADGPAKVVREDPYNPDLLFAGTEFALYASIDRGERWVHLSNGLPTVAVDDVQIHPREHDLIVATHGAALWVMDDIEALEGASAKSLAEPATLFDLRTAYSGAYVLGTQDPSPDEFSAKNAPDGAIIDYHIKSYTGDTVRIAIKSPQGYVVRTLEGPDYPGINRVVWDLHPKAREGEFGGFAGRQPPFVAPGTYTVTLSVGKTSVSKKLRVVKYDPAWGGLRMRAR